MIEFKLQAGTDETTGGKSYYYVFPSRNNNSVWQYIQNILKTSSLDNMHFVSLNEALDYLYDNVIVKYKLQSLDSIQIIDTDNNILKFYSKISKNKIIFSKNLGIKDIIFYRYEEEYTCLATLGLDSGVVEEYNKLTDVREIQSFLLNLTDNITLIITEIQTENYPNKFRLFNTDNENIIFNIENKTVDIILSAYRDDISLNNFKKAATDVLNILLNF